MEAARKGCIMKTVIALIGMLAMIACDSPPTTGEVPLSLPILGNPEQARCWNAFNDWMDDTHQEHFDGVAWDQHNRRTLRDGQTVAVHFYMKRSGTPVWVACNITASSAKITIEPYQP